MKVRFEVENISAEKVPFAFRLYSPLVGFEKVESKFGSLLLRQSTQRTYDPGARVVIAFDWPFENFTPYQVLWAPGELCLHKWLIHSATVDGKPLIKTCPAKF